MFTQEFDKYVCIGDKISTKVGPFKIMATIEYDYDYTIDSDDCHNVDQSVTGCNDEQHKALMAAREAWNRDQWFYGVVVLSVELDGGVVDPYLDSLGAIEVNYPNGDNRYLMEVANELLTNNLPQLRELRETLLEGLTTAQF